MSRGRAQAGQLGHPADEPDFVHRLPVGQIEDLAKGVGALRGQENAVNKILYVNAIEGLLPRAEIGKRPTPQVQEQLGQNGAITLAVDEAGADDDRGERAILVVP